jgi:hypothetical protein
MELMDRYTEDHNRAGTTDVEVIVGYTTQENGEATPLARYQYSTPGHGAAKAHEVVAEILERGPAYSVEYVILTDRRWVPDEYEFEGDTVHDAYYEEVSEVYGDWDEKTNTIIWEGDQA